MFPTSRPARPAPRRFGAARASLAATLALFGFQQSHAAVECVGKVGTVILYQSGIVGVVGDWNPGAPLLPTYGSTPSVHYLGLY